MRFKLSFAALFLTAALAAHSQVAPSATQDRIPLIVGLGFSDYYTDWSGNLSGPTLWIDVPIYRVPRIMHGIGLEIEGRDLNYGRTGADPKLRQDTAEGGVIYRWSRFRNFRPYGKILLGFGSQDFRDYRIPYYTHDTRSILAPGGGAEYRVWRNLWVRGDYEYQFWPDFISNNGALNPQGVTVGAEYDLRHLFARQ